MLVNVSQENAVCCQVLNYLGGQHHLVGKVRYRPHVVHAEVTEDRLGDVGEADVHDPVLILDHMLELNEVPELPQAHLGVVAGADEGSGLISDEVVTLIISSESDDSVFVDLVKVLTDMRPFQRRQAEAELSDGVDVEVIPVDEVQAPLPVTLVDHTPHVDELVGHARSLEDLGNGSLQLEVYVGGGLVEAIVDGQVVLQQVLRDAVLIETVQISVKVHGEQVHVELVTAAVENRCAAQGTETPAAFEDPEVVIALQQQVVDIMAAP